MAEKKDKKKKQVKKIMSLRDVMKAVNKKYGKGTLLPASEATSLVIDRLPTGVFDLDMKLGGGWARGRINMIKGDWSTGKSGLCLKAVAEAQRQCRFCGKPFESVNFVGEVEEFECDCGENEPMKVVWMDAEHSLDPRWMAKFGIVTDDVMVIETEYAEQAIDIADLAIRSRDCDLLVVDSIAALTPGVEVEESSEKWQMGVLARLMGKALRKWTSGLNSFGLLGKTKCTLLLVNQERLSIGGYHAFTTSPGGKGFDYFESIEIRMKRQKEFIQEKSTERPIAIDIEYVVKKNKTAPPSPGGAFCLYFIPSPGNYIVGGTDTDAQVFKLALYWGLVTKKKSWFFFPNGEKCHGKAAAKTALRENPELLSSMQTLIRAKELVWMERGEGREIVVEEDEDEEEDE